MAKKYTLEQVNEIVDTQNWSSTLCSNEKDGQECEGIDTIQIAVDSNSEYFGEFVGANNDYEFILYTL